MSDITARILSELSRRDYQPLKAKALARKLNVGDDDYPAFRRTVKDLVQDGRIDLGKNNVRLRVVWDSEDDGTCPSCTNQWGDLGGDLWYRWEF